MNVNTILAGLLAAAVHGCPVHAQSTGTDQTVTVVRGARLEVDVFAGSVVIEPWDRDAIRVRAEHSARDRIEIEAGSIVVSVRPSSPTGPPRSIDLRITIPRWMRTEVDGTYADVTVEGVEAELHVETVRGDVTVRGGVDFVSLSSVEGAVSLTGARGRVNVRSVNERITLSDVSGDVIAETVNGSITLERITSSRVEGATVNGNVSYNGTIRDDGQYRLTTHNGNIDMTVPDGTNATVSARTFNGEFVLGFPAKLEEGTQRRRRLDFTVGRGSARIDLESFGGTIRLARPGEPAPPR